MYLADLAKRAILPPDTWERHTIVAQLAGSPETVLDVGGVGGQLGLFMPDAKITTLNLGNEDADVHFDGLRIPYADNSFDVAVSLDVLEHIERSERAAHFSELARVAHNRIVLCCPLGTDEHIEAERELSTWYRQVAGRGHRFLDEHIERGLPTESEIAALLDAAGLDADFRFHGDFRDANQVFKLSTLARRRPNPRTLAAYVLARFSPRRDLRLARQCTPWSNRVFIVTDQT